MKKILLSLLFLVLSVCFMFPQTGVYAASSDDKSKRQHISEYEVIKSLQSKKDADLKKEGLDDAKIKDLRNLDYKSELAKRSKLDEKILKGMGYTDQQISLLKQYDKSEAQTLALASTMDIYSQPSSITNDGKDWYIGFSWGWYQQPVYLATDIIGLRWLGSVNGTTAACTMVSSGTYCNVNYYYVNQSWTSGSVAVTSPDITTGQMKIPMYIMTRDSAGNSIQCWAKSGSGKIHINNSSSMDRLSWKFQYGHSTWSVDPSVSVSTSGSVSFGFKPTSYVGVQATSGHTYDKYGKLISDIN